MKYTAILTASAFVALLVSCEKKNNEEGTAAPSLEKTVQTAEARFAADMVGVPLGKYVPVSEVQNAAPGQTVYVKGSILRKSVAAEGQDHIFVVVDPEKLKAELIDGKVKSIGDPTPEEILANTMIATVPQQPGTAPAFEELDQVLIIGTMEEPKTDNDPFKVIKVNSISKQPKDAAK